jgi:hypothetical protein
MRDRVIDAQNERGGGRKKEPAERWSRGELDRLHGATDPKIDRVVAAYLRDHPEFADARNLVMSMIRELSEAKRDPQWFTRRANGPEETWLTDALEIALAPPPWNPDPELIARGQRVFADYGLYQASALFFASLPMAYATVEGAEVLARVSDLATQDLTRRVAETGRMLIDVMGLRGGHSLDSEGPGYTTAIGLRLMHACVRALILDQPAPDSWPPAEDFGPPVNQELMLGTLLDFTVVTWEAMNRMGIALEAADREANLHAWSYVGLLMGVEACRDGALGLDDVEQIEAGMSRLLGSSEAGQRLMTALLREMEDFMPLGWRKLPRSVVRWLFRGAPDPVRQVPDLLQVPPAAWWSIPLQASLREANRNSRWLGPLAWPAHRLIRKLGRHVLISYSDRYATGPTPFRIPAELAGTWRIRTSARARWVRDKRYRVRHAARTPIRRPGGRGSGRGPS